MGTRYTTQTQTGYNASPPPDDGSTTASNKITWGSTIKTKLADPILTLAQAINTTLLNALNYAFSLNTTTYTTVAADNCTVIENTGSNTVSLGDAASMGAGYIVGIKNTGTGLTTVALITAANTLDGTANGTITVPPKQCVFFAVNQAANGYDIIAGNTPYRQGADVSSATTTVLDRYDGDYVHVTGTTAITAITLGKGASCTVEFTGILTLTNGASLILPGGANITTAAGDTAIFRGEASGVVRCILYSKASGAAVVPSTSGTITAGTPLVQSPMANATVTQAHGLSAKPNLPPRVFATCLTGESNWVAGDTIELAVHQHTSGSSSIWSIGFDATNVVLYNSGGQPNANDKSTRANFNMTLANWSLTIVPLLRN